LMFAEPNGRHGRLRAKGWAVIFAGGASAATRRSGFSRDSDVVVAERLIRG